MNRYLIASLIISLSIIAYSFGAYGYTSDLNEFPVSQIEYSQLIKMKISNKDITRISFWPLKIKKLEGDLLLFISNVPKNTSELYIRSKAECGKKIKIKIFFENSDPIDLELETSNEVISMHVKIDHENAKTSSN
jgi:hypothetical protein